MGTSNLCVDDAHKSIEFERSQQSMSMTINQGHRTFTVPNRTSSVNQIYQKLIEEKCPKYSLQATKTQYEPMRLILYGDEGIYIGAMQQGKPHGPGQVYFENNNFLQAVFNKGELECDDAILIESNGNYYRGDWDGSTENIGFGVARQIFGWQDLRYDLVYEGNGQLQFSDGKFYKGQFKNGKMHGKGKIVQKNGSVYEGYFREGKRWGIGYLKTEKYEYFGPFENDLKQGKATLVMTNGDKFEGWFQKDKLNGYGELHRKTGEVIKRKYEDQPIQKLII